jgi:hypothetical protein
MLGAGCAEPGDDGQYEAVMFFQFGRGAFSAICPMLSDGTSGSFEK